MLAPPAELAQGLCEAIGRKTVCRGLRTLRDNRGDFTGMEGIDDVVAFSHFCGV